MNSGLLSALWDPLEVLAFLAAGASFGASAAGTFGLDKGVVIGATVQAAIFDNTFSDLIIY